MLGRGRLDRLAGRLELIENTGSCRAYSKKTQPCCRYPDLLDARLEQAWRLIDQEPADEEWTSYVPSLERQLYRLCPLGAEPKVGESNDVKVLSGKAASSLETVAQGNGHH